MILLNSIAKWQLLFIFQNECVLWLFNQWPSSTLRNKHGLWTETSESQFLSPVIYLISCPYSDNTPQKYRNLFLYLSVILCFILWLFLYLAKSAHPPFNIVTLRWQRCVFLHHPIPAMSLHVNFGFKKLRNHVFGSCENYLEISIKRFNSTLFFKKTIIL